MSSSQESGLVPVIEGAVLEVAMVDEVEVADVDEAPSVCRAHLVDDGIFILQYVDDTILFMNNDLFMRPRI